MPIRSLKYIGLTSLIVGASAQFTPAEAKPLSTSDECNAVGRVVQIANSQLREGQLLCFQDRIQISPNKALKFVCYSSGQEITLSQGGRSAGEYCDGVSYRLRRCTNQYPVSCINGRNPNIKVRATLLFPYSSTVVSGRPSLTWEAEPSADKYTVELLLSNQLKWKQTVSTNSMVYPSGPSVEPLQPGKAYLIKVLAFRNDNLLSQNKSTLNRLPEENVAKMQSAIASIDALPIPALDKILDRDKIYISQGLLSKSIEILKAQLKQDPTNPLLHRVLGDRYMNAGLPKAAQPYFQEAKSLADKKQNTIELAKANAGLAEITSLPAPHSNPTTN